MRTRSDQEVGVEDTLEVVADAFETDDDDDEDEDDDDDYHDADISDYDHDIRLG